MAGIVRILSWFWRALDGLRRVLHLIILLFVFALLLAAFSIQHPKVPRSAALLIAPEGDIVEQLQGDALDRAWAKVTGDDRPQTLLRDIVDALSKAKDDDRIKVVLLDIDGLQGAGLSKLQTIAGALQAFRSSGKTVIAVGDYFSQNQYFLAANADEVYMHPLGVVYLDGYGRYRTFFKEALDKLHLDANVFRVGEYKSFGEPYSRSSMSEEDKRVSLEWLTELWSVYQADVERARGLDEKHISEYVGGFLEALRSRDGDLAAIALDAGLVNELWTRDQVRDRLIELVGVDKTGHDYSRVTMDSYLATVRAAPDLAKKKNVGVIVAAGTILDGEQPPGAIGGDSLAGLIRQARQDDAVQAVLLRVDSGGGSMFASKVIHRELELLRDAGKPLVVSMGSVAASGGYFISMPGEEIWASPTTITGSIGIIAMFPTVDRALDKLGVHVDGVGTTQLSGQFRPDRPLGDAAREILQLNIQNSYRVFVGDVASARGKTFEEVDAVAQGRVWTGARAHELGLVDNLGGQEEAVLSAATRAGIEADYGIKYIEKPVTFGDQLALELLASGAQVSQWLGVDRRPSSPVRQLVAALEQRLGSLLHFNDPRGIYSFCFCEVQ